MLTFGIGCKIDESAKINVLDGFIGEGTVISAGVVIEGTRVQIGRESFLDRGAYIGGGSCFNQNAFLTSGDWLHMGVNSHINIAMGVSLGESVGIGVETKLFTHGAYLDSYKLGAPRQWASIEIGDNVWIPNAWINPGVKIGSNVVIAARSLVNKDIPSGCLAGGVPAQVLKEHYLPNELSDKQKTELLQDVVTQTQTRPEWVLDSNVKVSRNSISLVNNSNETIFDLEHYTISGPATINSKVLKDQLRRNGVRFKFQEDNGYWVPWFR